MEGQVELIWHKSTLAQKRFITFSLNMQRVLEQFAKDVEKKF